MSKVVWKYELPVNTFVTLTMPIGAKVLCVHQQGGRPQLWALVDIMAATEDRRFLIAGTGQEFEGANVRHDYVGTVFLHDDALVFHVFEVIACPAS